MTFINESPPVYTRWLISPNLLTFSSTPFKSFPSIKIPSIFTSEEALERERRRVIASSIFEMEDEPDIISREVPLERDAIATPKPIPDVPPMMRIVWPESVVVVFIFDTLVRVWVGGGGKLMIYLDREASFYTAQLIAEKFNNILTDIIQSHPNRDHVIRLFPNGTVQSGFYPPSTRRSSFSLCQKYSLELS